ncbi:MAG: hypothetical protein CMF23_11475 [Ignavibacteriae bacterium]|nr:hypothetical protein [Ignavibacteriota bacterium]
MQQGIYLFNSSNFFEAHDYFEDLWNEAERKDRKFYQALVQISVGSFHLISKNYKGALSQYCKGTSKLIAYVPNYNGVNTAKLLMEIEILISDLNAYFEEKICSVEPNKIPKIELTN